MAGPAETSLAGETSAGHKNQGFCFLLLSKKARSTCAFGTQRDTILHLWNAPHHAARTQTREEWANIYTPPGIIVEVDGMSPISHAY